MGDRTRGIFHKFDVTRVDGTSAPGGKHEGCFYFVLDLDHDPHAKAALQAYADSCRTEYPLLATDLDVCANQCEFGRRALPTNCDHDWQTLDAANGAYVCSRCGATR